MIMPVRAGHLDPQGGLIEPMVEPLCGVISLQLIWRGKQHFNAQPQSEG